MRHLIGGPQVLENKWQFASASFNIFNISSFFESILAFIFKSTFFPLKKAFHVLISMLMRPSSAFSSKFFPSVILRSKRARSKKESNKYWMRVGKRSSKTVKKNNWLRIGKRMVCVRFQDGIYFTICFQEDDQNGQKFLIRVGKRQLRDSITSLKKQFKREF